jgi:5,6-dimethylbenzimidazole synthase|tara:strand:- start:3943 stop:4350 length:408 start_codon:yes stop_codon:yes gene_type:complete
MIKSTELDKQGFNCVLYNRRAIKSHFLSDPVDESVLLNILTAADHAPSVGSSQSWNFIIKDDKVKQDVYQAFIEANLEAKDMFDGQRRDLYQSLKLQTIIDAPIYICIVCDRDHVSSFPEIPELEGKRWEVCEKV